MIGPTSSISGYDAVQRAAAATVHSFSGFPATAAPQSPMANLTADDRAVINKAYGLDLKADGSGLAPASVLMIAIDRTTGRLPAGQPLTATYLHDIARRTSRADATSIDGIQKMIDVLTGRGQVDRLDIRN